MKYSIPTLLLVIGETAAQATVNHQTHQLRGALAATDLQYSGCSFGKLCFSNSDCCSNLVCMEFPDIPGPTYCLRDYENEENKLLGTNEKLKELDNGKKDYVVEKDISSDFVEEQRGCYSLSNPCSSDSDAALLGFQIHVDMLEDLVLKCALFEIKRSK